MDRKIKFLIMNFNRVIDNSVNGEITEFWKKVKIHTECDCENNKCVDINKYELWYKQGNNEFNGAFVTEIHWE